MIAQNEQGKVSATKIGLYVAGFAMLIQQMGIDIVESSIVDEKVIKILLVVGLTLAGKGYRDAIGKVGK